MKENKQQQNLTKIIIKQRKTLPIELLFNIFREANNLFSNELQKCTSQKTFFNLKQMRIEKTTKNQLIKYLYNYAKNLLTSSCIVYIFVGKYFKKSVQQFETVFVWDMDTLCEVLPENHVQKVSVEQQINEALENFMKYGFMLKDDAFELTNIWDAKTDLVFKKETKSGSTLKLPPISSIFDREPISSLQFSSHMLTGITTMEGLLELNAKCRIINNEFDKYRSTSALTGLLNEIGVDSSQFFKFMDNIEKIGESNTAAYRDCLSLLYKRSANVLLSSKTTNYSVAKVLGKLMLCRMGKFFESHNVYSVTQKDGIGSLFERLKNTFHNKKFTFICASEEIKESALMVGLNYSSIDSLDDLIKFCSSVLLQQRKLRQRKLFHPYIKGQELKINNYIIDNK
ncbi:hypothetical protein ACQ4LE_009292 [Meloidogyne hapla]